MNEEELRLLLSFAAAIKEEKSIVEKASDLVVDVIEAPFKIAGSLFDDLFDL